MGTPDRLLKITADIKSGKVRKLNNQNKRKAIFRMIHGHIGGRRRTHKKRKTVSKK